MPPINPIQGLTPVPQAAEDRAVAPPRPSTQDFGAVLAATLPLHKGHRHGHGGAQWRSQNEGPQALVSRPSDTPGGRVSDANFFA